MKHTIPRKYFKVSNIPYCALYLRVVGSIVHNLMRVLWGVNTIKNYRDTDITLQVLYE